MTRTPIKLFACTLAAALLLAGCGAMQASQAASSAAESAVPVSGAASAPNTGQNTELPEDQSTPDQSVTDQSGASPQQTVPVAPSAGQNWFLEDDEEFFDPFAQETPALPEGPLTPVSQADMNVLLAGKQQASWLYHMEDTGLAYQYRFLSGNMFSASLGLYETDSGIYSYGTCRFLEDGLLEAMVWLPDDPADPADDLGADDHRQNASPVYMTVRLERADDSRETLVATLLTLEDTTPDGLMAQYFLKTAGVPLPLALEKA